MWAEGLFMWVYGTLQWWTSHVGVLDIRFHELLALNKLQTSVVHCVLLRYSALCLIRPHKLNGPFGCEHNMECNIYEHSFNTLAKWTANMGWDKCAIAVRHLYFVHAYVEFSFVRDTLANWSYEVKCQMIMLPTQDPGRLFHHVLIVQFSCTSKYLLRIKYSSTAFCDGLGRCSGTGCLLILNDSRQSWLSGWGNWTLGKLTLWTTNQFLSGQKWSK